MSSILDALRKVEADKTKEKVDLGAVEDMLAEKELLVPEEEEEGRRSAGAHRAAIVLVSVAVVGLCGAGGFSLYGRLTGGRHAGAAGNQAGGPAPARLPGQPVVEEPSEEAAPSPASVAESQAPAPMTSEPGSAVEEPTVAQENVPASPEASADSVASVAQKPALKINILRPPSEQFPEALAVVNGRRVAVGESVDGAEILEIRRDGILFEYAGESFFVQF
jgi:hypothetical protein